MNVIARKGLRVPKENAPRQYITDEKAVTVPDTVYYTRRVMDGDLIEQTATAVDVVTDTGAITAGDKKTAKGA